jgi:hypothetical protein
MDNDGARNIDAEVTAKPGAGKTARRGDIVVIRRPYNGSTNPPYHLALVLAVPGATATGVLYAYVNRRFADAAVRCGYMDLGDRYEAEPQLCWAVSTGHIQSIIRTGNTEQRQLDTIAVLMRACEREYRPQKTDQEDKEEHDE